MTRRSQRHKIMQAHELDVLRAGATAFHTVITRQLAVLDIGSPHYQALSRLHATLCIETMAITGEAQPPWVKIWPSVPGQMVR